MLHRAGVPGYANATLANTGATYLTLGDFSILDASTKKRQEKTGDLVSGWRLKSCALRQGQHRATEESAFLSATKLKSSHSKWWWIVRESPSKNDLNLGLGIIACCPTNPALAIIVICPDIGIGFLHESYCFQKTQQSPILKKKMPLPFICFYMAAANCIFSLKCVNVRANHPPTKFTNETGRSWTWCYKNTLLGMLRG